MFPKFLNINPILLRIILSCFYFISFLYLLVEVFFKNYTLYLILIITILMYFAIYLLRLLPAESMTVTKVLGPVWGAYKENDKPPLEPLKIIAHRACGLDAPENSISALKKVIKEGITAVEFDVMLTSDKVPVVFHDDTLVRVANVPKSIDDLTFAELEKIDISTTHPFRMNYINEKVPALKTFIQCCVINNVTMIIDIKDASMAPSLIRVFNECPRLAEMAIVSSFDPLVVYKIRTAIPKIAGCLAWRPYYYSYEEYSGIDGPTKPRTKNPIIHHYHLLKDVIYSYFLRNFIYHLLGLSALLLHKDMISRDVIDYWKKRGIRVLAWTVNNPVEKDFFERFLQIPYLTDTVICS